MKRKETLRKSMLVSLSKLSTLKRHKIEKELHKQLFSSTFWSHAETVGLTLSQDIEWDTRTIVEQAWKESKRVCVPKTIHQRKELHFYEIKDFDQVVLGYFNIEEPDPEKTKRVRKESIDLLIVPGVLFNRQGYRIGFGGGYYDRFLQSYAGTRLSLIHSNQFLDDLPIENHDIPVQFILTENETITCGGADIDKSRK